MAAAPRKPTMQDVARLAGVSMMTVSRVLTEPARVAATTRERIQQAIEQLGYVPDMVAGALASRRTGFIAAILPTLTNANFADMARGLTEATRRTDHQLLIGYTSYDTREEERLIRTMLARRPEGIVLTGAVHTKTASRLLLNAGVPVIETWELPPQPVDHAVGFSNREVGRAAARHLLELGHRRLGVLAPLAEGTARDFRGEDRLAGFATVLEEEGLAGALTVHQERVPLSFEQGAKGFAALLARTPDLDAVFAISDLMAVGALMECHRRGIRVPHDLSLLGFGDFEIGRQCVPAMTTIRIDAKDIGWRTGKLLLRLLRLEPGAGGGDPNLIDVGFKLVERETTAPAKCTHRAGVRQRRKVAAS